MSRDNIALGKIGENIALKLLQSKSIEIIETNFRTKFGEIDIIARNKDKLLFIEVKTRIGVKKGQPYEAVTKSKIRHMQKAVQYFLLQKKLKGYKLSLQVISIILDDNLKVVKINYFEEGVC